IRHAFKVSTKEGRYRKTLQSLGEWNSRLRSLRKNTWALQDPRYFAPSSAAPRRIAPRCYPRIREASRSLHSSLMDAWSCSNASHEARQAKLLLHPETAFDQVCLDFAISCRQRDSMNNSGANELPIWLYAKPITAKNDVSSPSVLSRNLASELAFPLEALLDDRDRSFTPQPRSKNGRFLSDNNRGKKRSRLGLRLIRDESPDDSVPRSVKNDAPKPGSDVQDSRTMNLRDAKSFCCHIKQLFTSRVGCSPTCLGFLESRDNARFIFYDTDKKHMAELLRRTRPKERVPLNVKINVLSQLGRLSLAYELASAVHRYYLTPWLPEDWNLRDISFFADGNANDSVQSLETLHLNAQFSPVNPGATLRGASSVQTELRFTYGIRNMTPAKLGLALLEIGYERATSSFNLEPQKHDVISARILADSPYTDLGPRYQRIARRCIECNFAADDSLDTEDLRNAVYTNVVCELENMISVHKKFPASIS
ncbi:hypothetical protein B0J12DRAFT_572796, partial [Macrophomina phaseolina]